VQAASQINPYHAQKIENASPVKLVGLLYDGFLRFAHSALAALDRQDFEAAHHAILKAYAIAAELQATLDLERGGEIAVNLERCYDFVLRQLTEANIRKSSTEIENCIRVVEPLAAAWCQAHSDASYSTLPGSVDDSQGSVASEEPDRTLQLQREEVSLDLQC
jgi:flagellar protein FliS